MSTFSYNGIVIDLPTTAELARTPYHDQATGLLHSKVRIRIRGVLNEDATAYTLRGRTIREARGDGIFPAETIKAIEWALQIPRRKLRYTDGETVVLESPEAGADRDAANGPVCVEGPTVVETLGSATLIIEVCYEVCLNSCGNFTDVLSLIASHTWETQEHLDFQEFSTRTIHGEATFHADRMAAVGRIPDDFRYYLFHPVPPKFRRDDVQVTATEDGLKLRYSVVDKLQYGAILDPFIKNIDGHHRVIYSRQSGNQIQLEMALAAARALSTITEQTIQVVQSMNAAQIAAGGVPAGVSVGAGLLRAGTALTIEGANLITGICPRLVHDVLVQVWGREDAEPGYLSIVAHRILSARLSTGRPADRAPLSRFSQSIIETRPLNKPYVELAATYTSGIPVGVVEGLAELAARVGVGNSVDALRRAAGTRGQLEQLARGFTMGFDPAGNFPQRSFPDPELRNLIRHDGSPELYGANPPPPSPRNPAQTSTFSRSEGSRGAQLARIAAAALAEPCNVPPRPTNPR